MQQNKPLFSQRVDPFAENGFLKIGGFHAGKRYDLLWYDLKFLLNEEPPQPKPSVCVPIDYTVRPFQEVEDEYRMLFKQLRADIHNSDLLDHD